MDVRKDSRKHAADEFRQRNTIGWNRIHVEKEKYIITGELSHLSDAILLVWEFNDLQDSGNSCKKYQFIAKKQKNVNGTDACKYGV